MSPRSGTAASRRYKRRSSRILLRQMFSPSLTALPNERNVPSLHRGDAAITAHDVHRCRIEEKTTSIGSSKAKPPRSKSPEQVAMREQGSMTFDLAEITVQVPHD